MSTVTEELPGLVPLRDASTILGLKKDQAYALARAGEFPIPVFQVGRLWKVKRADLTNYLAG